MAPKRKSVNDSYDDFFVTDKNGKMRLQQTNLVKLRNKGMQERADHDTRKMRQLLMYRGSEECKKASGVNVCK